MNLFLMSAIPLILLLIFGSKLKSDSKLILKVLCVPFVLLVAFYSFIAAALFVAAYLVYWKFFVSKQPAKPKKDEWQKINWEE